MVLKSIFCISQKDFHSFSRQGLRGKWETGRSWPTSNKSAFLVEFKSNILTNDIFPKSILHEALNRLISIYRSLNGEFWPFLLLVSLKKIRQRSCYVKCNHFCHLKNLLIFSDRFCSIKNLKENPSCSSCHDLGFLVGLAILLFLSLIAKLFCSFVHFKS